jgi:peptide/nickel transport system substrate-binding protein
MYRATVRTTGGRSSRAVVVASALLFVLGLAWGLSATRAEGSPSPSASAAPLTAQFGTTFDADNLNPFIGWSGTSYEIFHLNYDFLVGYDTDLAPRPELATAWSVTADGKTWTFTLRPGVKWQDGKPFTARDVAFTYNYIIDNDLTAFTSYTNGIESAEAVDPYTVVMHCSKPKANMLRLWIPILPEHIWSGVPGDRAGKDWAVKPPIIGTGPFQTVEVKKGQYVKLVKNPHYWLPGKPRIDELVLAVYQNADTMTQDLKTGTLDYALGIPPAQFRGLQPDPSLKVNAAELRYFDEIAMNCYDSADSQGNPVLRDPRFRQAISWAVDKQKIVDLSYGGFATVAQGLIAPDVPTYYWQPPTASVFGFDLQKAGQMLTDAGYPLKDGARVDKRGRPITLRLWARADDVASQSTGKLVTGWFSQLGLTIDYQTLDSGAISDALYNYVGDTYAPDYDMYIWSWGQYVDPDYILGVFTSAQIGGWNDACWSNAEYDKLYAQQARTIDPAERKPLVDRMAEIFYAEAPFIITDYEQQLEAYNTEKWEGWTQVPPGTGPAAFVNDNIDTYLNLRPRLAVEPASGGGGSTAVYVAVAVIVLAVAIVVVLLLRRGRGRMLEE